MTRKLPNGKPDENSLDGCPHIKRVGFTGVDTIHAFLVAAQASPHRGFYHLAVLTGMRRGELYGPLYWKDGEGHHWNALVWTQPLRTDRLNLPGWLFDLRIQGPKLNSWVLFPELTASACGHIV